MRTTIDKAGRLVIPRPLRDRLGLADGGEVELDVHGGGIRIEPVVGHGMVEEDGFLVIPPSGAPLDDDAVRELRWTPRAASVSAWRAMHGSRLTRC